MRCDFDFVPATRGRVGLHVSVALELFDEEGVHMVQVGSVSHRCDRRVESYMITSLEIAQFISIQGHSLIGQTQTDISSVHPFTVIQVHLDQNVTAVVHHCHGIIVVHVNPYDVAVPADAFTIEVSLKLRHCLSWTLLEGIKPAIGTVACPGDGSDRNLTEISRCSGLTNLMIVTLFHEYKHVYRKTRGHHNYRVQQLLAREDHAELPDLNRQELQSVRPGTGLPCRPSMSSRSKSWT